MSSIDHERIIRLLFDILCIGNYLSLNKNTKEALSRQPWGNFLSLTAGRKLPKSESAILFSAEGPASEYWPPVKLGEPDRGL